MQNAAWNKTRFERRQTGRPPLRHPLRARFGRGRRWATGPLVQQAPQRSTLRDDLKLFAMTFAGGFLFVSVLIA